MAEYVYDAAYEPTDLNALKANGGIALARYFVGNNPTLQWKRVTPPQVMAIRMAGLGVVVNFEGSSNPLDQARRAGIPYRTAGQNDARAALTDIKSCGVPQDGTVACYFSLDTGYTSADFPAIEELAKGWHDIMVPARIQVKVYADGVVIDHLISVGLVDGKQWLAAPTSWDGFNSNDPNLCMVQLVGSPVSGTDQDHVVLDPSAVGAYWPDNSPYWPNPTETDLTPDQDSKLTYVYNFLKTIPVDPGQLSASAELGAILPAAQQLFNKLNAVDADVTGGSAALQAAVAKLEADVTAAVAAAPGPQAATVAADAVVKEFAAKLGA